MEKKMKKMMAKNSIVLIANRLLPEGMTWKNTVANTLEISRTNVEYVANSLCRWGPWLYICELIPARCLMCAKFAKKALRSKKGCDCTKGHILENGLMLASIATRNSLVEVNSWFIGTLFYKIFHIPLALNEVKWPFSVYCNDVESIFYIYESLNGKNL